MPDWVALCCTCGAVEGHAEVSRRNAQRVVCYCDDCQAFARFLERDDMLDAHGGTDIVQTRLSVMRLTAGADKVACMRLSDKGMLHWYTRCCRMAIGNTMTSSRMPFVGLLPKFFTDLDVLGLPIERIQGKFAIGGLPVGAHPITSPGIIARIALMLGRSLLARGHKPSPFFDSRGEPIVKPEVLTAQAREALWR